MKVTFTTCEYELSHGRKPRGRGSWAFQVISVDYRMGEGPVVFSPGNMTLTEAKRWFKTESLPGWAEAEKLTGHFEVSVLP